VSVENLDADTGEGTRTAAPFHQKRGCDGRRPSSPKADPACARVTLIQEVNHRPVRNVAEFEQAMHKAGKEELCCLSIACNDAVHRA